MGDNFSFHEHIAFRFEAMDRLLAERDRRYSEVAAARAEALRIKEEGDRRALELARTIQEYRDEQANRLREQINQERGLYPTKSELDSSIDKVYVTINPLVTYVAAQQGRSGGMAQGWQILTGLVLLAIAVAGWWSKAGH